MRRLEKSAIAVVLSAGLVVGCGASRPGEGPSASASSSAPVSETASATAAPMPSLTPSETRSPTVTATPSVTSTQTTGAPRAEVFSGDQSIKNGLQQAGKGDEVTLNNPLIGSITRIPTFGGDSYIATIWIKKSPTDNDVVATVPNGKCLFDALKADGELGPRSLIPGRWTPSRRIDQLTGNIAVASTLFTPKPSIHLDSIIVGGEKVPC